MSREERASLAPSGRKCVDCGKPAGTPWGPHFCSDCDDKRIERINRGMAEIQRRFAAGGGS